MTAKGAQSRQGTLAVHVLQIDLTANARTANAIILHSFTQLATHLATLYQLVVILEAEAASKASTHIIVPKYNCKEDIS